MKAFTVTKKTKTTMHVVVTDLQKAWISDQADKLSMSASEVARTAFNRAMIADAKGNTHG